MQKPRALAWLPAEVPARVVLWSSLLLGFALKLRIVFTDDGINWPDEIYQSFEPAHRLVFGYGIVAWEFIEGARTWAVPGFVAVWLWLAKGLGATDPQTFIHLVKGVFSALSAVAALGVYRLARGFGARELEAAVASALWSLCAYALYFSPRAMSENLAAPLAVWGLALIFEADATVRGRVLGASALGLATIARLQLGTVCVVVLVALALREGPTLKQRWAAVAPVLISLIAWALVYGAWDAAAWHHLPGAKAGGFFHSAVVYWRFNIVENRGAAWGTSDAWYYFQFLYKTMPGVTVLLGVSALLSVRRAWPVVLVLVGFFALHLYVGHKEMRFLVPAVPLACALFGVAVAGWGPRLQALAVAVALGCVAVSAFNHRALTMGDVGSYLDRGHTSAWDDYGGVNRLILAANREPSTCGLRIDAVHLAWTGGSTYLHREVPIYRPGTDHRRGFFNLVITRPGSGAPVLAREGEWELVKIADTCVPDPGYDWQLH